MQLIEVWAKKSIFNNTYFLALACVAYLLDQREEPYAIPVYNSSLATKQN